jgi:pyruvate,water dikinase
VTGARDETIVSAVKGLGDRLVSGQASPDEWVVRGDDAICRAAPEGALDASLARAVADLAQRVQTHYGGVPQDVEWAIDGGGTLFLLQARPVTALPQPAADAPAALQAIPVPVEVPPGFWEREASHFPRPLSPMGRSVLLSVETAAVRHVFDEFSLLVETLEHREIGGWMYQRMVPLGGKDVPAPPAWLMPLLIRLVPRLRNRIRGCVEAVRSDKHGRLIERWYDEWYPEALTRISSLRAVDLDALSDEALDRHMAEVLRFTSQSADRHFLLHGALCLVLGELAFTCRDMLGWEDQRTLHLLDGLSTKSTEPGRALAKLADLARSRPAVPRLLERGEISDAMAEQLAQLDPEFASAFAAYQSEYGCRALSYDVADPTVAETPSLSLALLRDQLVRGYAPDDSAARLERRRRESVAEARAALVARPAADRERFERTLARAERAYPVREDNEWYTVSAPIALMRYASLEVGRRLLGRGQIVRRDDVFFLEIEEARAALRDGADRRALVARRRGERAWVEAHPGLPRYGRHPGPPPSFAALPAEARFAMEALLWVTGHVFAAEQSGRRQADGTALRGIAASAGRYTGTVRVILGEEGFSRLRAGDVLVCPITSPVWSVLFPSVGALVTDTGGILSHAAIIAREYRVPAVVATGDATRRLRDGQVVTVNGTTGVVELGPAE